MASVSHPHIGAYILKIAIHLNVERDERKSSVTLRNNEDHRLKVAIHLNNLPERNGRRQVFHTVTMKHRHVR